MLLYICPIDTYAVLYNSLAHLRNFYILLALVYNYRNKSIVDPMLQSFCCRVFLRIYCYIKPPNIYYNKK